MEMKEVEYHGGSLNGFLMCAIDVLLWIAVVATFVYGIIAADSGRSFVWYIVLAVLFLIAAIICCCGFSMLEPNQAKVMTFFGRYVVVWRLKDTYKAIFDIDTDVSTGNQAGSSATARMNKFERFVAVQSDSALRQVASMYAYDNSDSGTEEITLRDGSDEINQELTMKLNERLDMAGLEVLEARINYLAYAPEIAAVMLRRQQAAAIITAREKIVDGAVSMVKMALDKLAAEEVVELDDEKKAAMVSNLLVVLCADEPAQPVINSGTLNH